MRLILLLSVVAASPAIVAAQKLTPDAQLPLTPPGYQMLRFDEDYSYLTNAANRTDFFDPAKYIPLRPNDPLWYLTFGGEVRERVEGNYDPNFGIGVPGSDTYLLQRITALADLHLGERFRFYTEGVSGIVVGNSQPAPPVQQDPGDLLFAFIDFVPWLTDDQSLTLRVGRYGLSFGAGRLVATRAAPNIMFRFQGLELLYSRTNWDVTAFVNQPVKDVGHISGSDHDTTFWGLYATHYFDAGRTTGLDLYYLGIHNTPATYACGTADELRHTLGTRQFGVWRNWDWDAEQVLQVGSFGNDSILAWTAAISGGYTWDTLFQPRLGIKTGIVSGNNDLKDGQLETFDPLFFKSGYFNDASLIRPSNLIGLHPNLTLQLSKNVEMDGGADWFWRYSRNDAVYAVPGQIAVPANPNAPSYIGTALDVNLNWQLQRHVTLQASYVNFLTGSYVREAGGRNVNYFSTTLTFLF